MASLAQDLTPQRAAKAYVALAVSAILAGCVVFVDIGNDGMTGIEWILVLMAALNPVLVWATTNSN